MNVKELYIKLDSVIPGSYSAEWDNDGLMCCSDTLRTVHKVLLVLDVTERVVDYAVKNGFDVIITHHPLLFKSVSSLSYEDFRTNKIFKLIKYDVTVLSFHSRLDSVDGGVNDVLAELFGLVDTLRFGPENEKIGRIGSLIESIQFYDFCKNVKNILNSDCLQTVDSGLPVKKVAVLGGSGKDFLLSAKKYGADTFITGEIPYNSMVDALDLGINVITAGHYYTEFPVLNYLKKIISAIDSSIKTEILSYNPIKTR